MHKLNSFFELLAQPSIKARELAAVQVSDGNCVRTRMIYFRFVIEVSQRPISRSGFQRMTLWLRVYWDKGLVSEDKVNMTFRNQSFTKLTKHQNHLWIFFFFLCIESEKLGIAFRNVCFYFLFFGFGVFFNSLSRWVNSRHFWSAFGNKWFSEDLFSLLAFSRSHVAKVRRLGPPKNIYHAGHLM